MYKIVLLGTGNVATHLFSAFKKSTVAHVAQVYNHRAKSLEPFKSKVATTARLSELHSADLYLVSISDDVVEEIIGQLAHKNSLIAHTTGSVPLLKTANRNGVFYPLQTFSKTKPVDFKNIPICLEAEKTDDYNLLREIAESISTKVYSISTQQRKALHLAAVFACNFTNHLYGIAEEICSTQEVPFEIMHPLIEETAQKIKAIPPKKGQTGPAIRRDSKTISRHLNQLDSPVLKEIYTLLTKSIQQAYE